MTSKKHEIELARAIYFFELTLSDIDETKCYFSEITGAYVLYMHGHQYHEEEMFVAKLFSDNGMIVILTPEDIKMYATIVISKNGLEIFKYPDGWLNGLTYEQRTIEKIEKDEARSVVKALEHVKTKFSDIAVIYDKMNLLKPENIENGIEQYENFATNKYRAKSIIVIDSNKNIKRYFHKK